MISLFFMIKFKTIEKGFGITGLFLDWFLIEFMTEATFTISSRMLKCPTVIAN